MNSRKSIYLILLLFVVFTSNAQTQKNVIDQSFTWFRYMPRIAWKNNYYTTYEYDIRFFNDGTLHTQVHRILTGKRFNNNLDVSLGAAYFMQYPQLAESGNRVPALELRPDLDIVYRNRLGIFQVNHRYRTEWRNFRRGSDKNGWFWQSSNIRFRYQLQAELATTYLIKQWKNASIICSGELLVNFGKPIVYNNFDQARYYIALRQRITPTLQFEIGYLKWFQQTARITNLGPDFYNRNILRTTLHHNLWTYKKKS